MKNNHNTHYSTTDILRSISKMIDEDLTRHPYGKPSLGMSIDEVRGYRLGLVSIQGALDSWLKYLGGNDDGI